MSDAAFIVLDVDGGEMLAECIASIRAQTVAPSEIVVLDNGSRVPARVKGARVIRSERNLGFAGGNNEAWRQVSADFIALVNNDVVLAPDWLATVRGAMTDRVAAVQTVIARPDGTIDGAGIDISDGTIRQKDSAGEAWGVSATAALYRRAAVGDQPFDPRFFAYYEDVELCARLHENGWRTVVLPAVKATHRGSHSASLLGRDAQRLRTRNRYFVARMHRGVGRIGALLWEDARLMVRGRASIRGIAQGLLTRL
jgi:N-acetylglucosaminyl-diphospho-decaprenol L-rhamnosyltransferase